MKFITVGDGRLYKVKSVKDETKDINRLELDTGHIPGNRYPDNGTGCSKRAMAGSGVGQLFRSHGGF